MADLILWGPFCDQKLLLGIVGRTVEAEPVTLTGHRLVQSASGGYARLVVAPESDVRAFRIPGADRDAVARIGHFARFFGLAEVDVDAAGSTSAIGFAPADGVDGMGQTWSGALEPGLARDVRGWYPDPVPPSRRAPMLVRAASRLRAQDPPPCGVRRDPDPDDVRTTEIRQPYARFFAVEEADLTFRRFDGTFSAPVTRAAFVSADAATVLPYDPVRDRVLVVEQFRTGPYLRGDPAPWHLEAIAGRIDPGETPQEAARREAEEEAGLLLGPLIPVASYYPSPGAKTEFLYSFVALTDLPDSAARDAGAPEEAEDIRGHLLTFEALMAAIASGEVATAPLILTALWLSRERDRLRREALRD